MLDLLRQLSRAVRLRLVAAVDEGGRCSRAVIPGGEEVPVARRGEDCACWAHVGRSRHPGASSGPRSLSVCRLPVPLGLRSRETRPGGGFYAGTCLFFPEPVLLHHGLPIPDSPVVSPAEALSDRVTRRWRPRAASPLPRVCRLPGRLLFCTFPVFSELNILHAYISVCLNGNLLPLGETPIFSARFILVPAIMGEVAFLTREAHDVACRPFSSPHDPYENSLCGNEQLHPVLRSLSAKNFWVLDIIFLQCCAS